VDYHGHPRLRLALLRLAGGQQAPVWPLPQWEAADRYSEAFDFDDEFRGQPQPVANVCVCLCVYMRVCVYVCEYVWQLAATHISY
jgi:hypothetical protein